MKVLDKWADKVYHLHIKFTCDIDLFWMRFSMLRYTPFVMQMTVPVRELAVRAMGVVHPRNCRRHG